MAEQDAVKRVLSSLPPLLVQHPAKAKDIRKFWDHHCSKILADAHLPERERVPVVLAWLHKAGVRDFLLGKMVSAWSRPLPPPLTEEQKKERNQKTLVKMTYRDDVPHLRALHQVVSGRLDGVPGDTAASFAILDARDGDADTAFAEFAKAVEEKALIEYRSMVGQSGDMFGNAA